MKLTKGIISRDEALKISPDYVAYVEGDFSKWQGIIEEFESLKQGQDVLTFNQTTWARKGRNKGQFVRARVTSIDYHDFRAVDGPIVRVTNGEFSWRVDGNKYAFPL